MAKYSPSEAHLKAVEQMAHKGVSHTKMSKALGISRSTFLRNIEHFEAYIKKGKAKVDQEAVDREIALVENALLKRCTGHTYDEIHTEQKKVGVGEPKVIHRKVIKKTIQPSDTAIMYYLGNRASHKWVSVNHAKEETKGSGATREETLEFFNKVTLGT